MLPFCVYFVAGALTAFHILVLPSLRVFGAARDVLELVSLLGAAGLVVCAYVALFKPWIAARIALLAALAEWSLYAPGIAATIRAGSRGTSLGFPDFRTATLPYLATALLVAATIYSALVAFRAPDANKKPSRLFPAGSRRMTRIVICVLSALATVGISAWAVSGARKSERPASRFLIPDGYVGWVRIEFQVAGAPAAPEESGNYVFRIPANGVLETSLSESFGWGKDEYFYAAPNGLRALRANGAPGQLIWGKINGERGQVSGKRQYEQFFVGTEEQFKSLAGASGSAGGNESSMPPRVH